MQTDGADKRIFGRLLQHLIELVDQHLREFFAGVAEPDDAAVIVALDRVGHGENLAGTRRHPDRLIVHGPVHVVGVALLLKQIERDRGVRKPGAHPACRALALVFFDCVSA